MRLLTVCALHYWIANQILMAQTQEPTFGVVHYFPTPERFLHFRMLESSAARPVQCVAWSRRTPVLWFGTMDSTRTSFAFRSLPVRLPLEQVIPLEGSSGFAFVYKGEKQLSIAELAGDTAIVERGAVAVPMTSPAVVAADLDRDRHIDLLAFSRDVTGLYPFYGGAGLAFKAGAVIAPDLAAADAAVLPINDDRSPDIALIDWVKQELHILYGIGKRRFIDQSVFPVHGDVRRIVVPESPARKFNGLMLAEEDTPRLQFWTRNPFGQFEKKFAVECKSAPFSILETDLNDDGGREVLLLRRPQVLDVLTNIDPGIPPERSSLFAGNDPRQIALCGDARDGRNDLLVLDGDGKRFALFGNGSRPVPLVDSLELVTGIRPVDVRIADFNGDGINDLAVLNTGAGVLSLYMGAPAGITGALQREVGTAPRTLAYHAYADSTMHFLISSPLARTISVFSWDLRDGSSYTTSIPVDGEADILSVHPGGPGRMNFFSVIASARQRMRSLSSFEQLGPERFIERSFQLTTPEAFLGAAVADVNRDNHPDVGIVYKLAESGPVEFSVILGDSVSGFRTRLAAFALPDSSIRRSIVWETSLSGGRGADFLVHTSGSVEMLTAVVQRNDSAYEHPAVLATGVRIAGRDQLAVADLDGDGVRDLVFNDLEQGGIGWMRGLGGSRFARFALIVEYPFIGGFTLGDLNGDSIPDLAVSLFDGGTVRLYDGAMVRKRLR